MKFELTKEKLYTAFFVGSVTSISIWFLFVKVFNDHNYLWSTFVISWIAAFGISLILNGFSKKK
jgi:hypothetical protein